MDEHPAGVPTTIVELLSRDVLDAELGGLLWLLFEGGVPVVVTSGFPGGAAGRVLDGLLGLLPARTRLVEVDPVSLLAGSDPPDGAGLAGLGDESGRTCLAARPLLSGDAGDALRVRWILRRVARGAGLAATARDASLADLFAHLSRSDIGLSDDELTLLGTVLVLDVDGRVAAAHYVRPLTRDAGGHVQRLGPAVLASRDQASGALEHFAWGIVPELADRLGRAPAAFEPELARRAGYLASLATARIDGHDQVRSAIVAYGTPAFDAPAS